MGYRALHDTPPIDLENIKGLRPQIVLGTHSQKCQENDCSCRGRVLILASKQKVSVPPDNAAEMIPYDPSVGKDRIHYAGFF